jgi:hypothetical protein
MATVAELILRQGEQDAAARERAGEIQAGLWGNLANIAARTGSQIAQEQQNAPVRQMQQLELQEAQKRAKFRTDLSDTLKNTPQVNEDGVSVWNVQDISNKLAGMGHGEYTGDVVKSLSGLNDAFRQERAARQAVIQRGAQEVQRAGDDPAFANHFLDQLDANGSLPKEQIAFYRNAIQQDPANVGRITAALAGPAKLKDVSAGGTMINENTMKPAYTAPPQAKPEPSVVWVDTDGVERPVMAVGDKYVATLKDGTKKDVTSEVTRPTPKAAAEKSYQTKTVMLDGKPNIEVLFDPDPQARQHYYDLDGKAIPNAASRIKGMPSPQLQGFGQALPEVTLNKEEERLAADLATGVLPFKSFGSMLSSRGGQLAAHKIAIYNRARDINPDFNVAAFEAGQKMFSDTQIRQRMNAIDQLKPVVDQITAMMDKAGNSDMPAINKLVLSGKYQFGDQTATNLRQLQTLLGDEVGNALGLGTGTDLKTRLGLDLVDENLSPANFRSNMKQLQRALQARRDNLSGMMGPYGDLTNPKAGPTPNLSGLAKGQKRTYNKGPFAGQTWTIGADGKPAQL